MPHYNKATLVQRSFTFGPGFDLTLHAGERGLAAVTFGGSVSTGTTDLLEEAARQLREWFAGERREFDVPLDLRGTEFQQRVWRELLAIPYGGTRSYLELAKAVGNVPRAVGQANGSNPVAIIVPCHRVINHNGGLGGYAGGLALKRWLLDFERINSRSAGQLSISIDISR
ncbi:MAG TPA: cysteine methyltransferase [Solibacterales bacterium]|nr:cysteine methyltransferase [Bryobacterales bacterium]